MTVLTFPSNPTEGQRYSAPNGIQYVYDGVKWIVEATTTTSEAITNATQDRVAPMFVNGDNSGITFTYNSQTNTMSAHVTSANGDRLVNGQLNLVFNSGGHLVFPAGSEHYDLGSGGSILSHAIEVNSNAWTFDRNGDLNLPEGGIIRNSDSTPYGIGVDGGIADNSVAISNIEYDLQTDQGAYDVSGSVSFTINNDNIDGTAVACGLIVKGLTTDHTQIINGSIGANPVTISWGSSGIDYALWQQVVSITIFVTDSRGYTFQAVATDSWDVPHGPCLVEGTQITMADGTHKAIEDIEHGELVRVWNFDLGEFSEAQPIWIKVAEETTGHDVYTFSDGTQLRTVGHHVFNKEAGAFTKFKEDTTPAGTTTFNEHGEEVTLLSKERVVAPTRYYNVWTQYHLNLFADGILTSNRFNNIYPIVDMKFVKDDRTLRSLDEFAGIDEKYITGLRLQEQTYSAEYISSYVHDRLEKLDIANQVEQGI
jgi:hypothetical protein